ncbi:Pre-mRNA-splicing factor ISY1-like protein, partial [Mucuna pruriens]
MHKIKHYLCNLNDKINKFIYKKSYWECRILKLGGPNLAKHFAKMANLDSNIINVSKPGDHNRNYHYFGTTKKLLDIRYHDDEDDVLQRFKGPIKDPIQRANVEEWRQLDEVRKERGRAIIQATTIVATTIVATTIAI